MYLRPANLKLLEKLYSRHFGYNNLQYGNTAFLSSIDFCIVQFKTTKNETDNFYYRSIVRTWKSNC